MESVLLLWTSFIPFPTVVMGDYPGNPVSLVLYGLVMSLMAASFSFMLFYILRNPGVLEASVDVKLFRKGTVMSVLFGPVMYLAGVAAGFVHPMLAFAFYLGIPVYFIFSENRK